MKPCQQFKLAIFFGTLSFSFSCSIIFYLGSIRTSWLDWFPRSCWSFGEYTVMNVLLVCSEIWFFQKLQPGNNFRRKFEKADAITRLVLVIHVLNCKILSFLEICSLVFRFRFFAFELNMTRLSCWTKDFLKHNPHYIYFFFTRLFWKPFITGWNRSYWPPWSQRRRRSNCKFELTSIYVLNI